MAEVGVKMGLDKETSEQLAMHTCSGAAKMALQSELDLVELRRRVCSPGGTTLKAVETFEQVGLAQLIESAMQAAFDRSVEMAKELG